MGLAQTRPRLAAFGSSQIGPKAAVYQDVRALSKKITLAGWDGMTGGHQGMMAAFSEGMHAGCWSYSRHYRGRDDKMMFAASITPLRCNTGKLPE